VVLCSRFHQGCGSSDIILFFLLGFSAIRVVDRTMYFVRSTTLNFSTRVGGYGKTHSCAHEAGPTLSAPHDSTRPSQRVAINLQFERQDEEVNRTRADCVHLLLVATKFRCSCSPPRGRHNLPRCSQSSTKHHVVRLAAMSISIARWGRLG
jgi:hypothetical protein